MTNPNVRNIDGLPAIMGQFDTFARTTTVRAMAEVGITVVAGSFEKGATGVTKGTGVYQESTGKVFQWQLTNTFNITAGTLPSNYGTVGVDWIDRTNDALRDEVRETTFQTMKRSYAEAGFNLVDGSFQVGGVLSGQSDVLWDWASGKGYQWHLNETKTVSAGSVPTNIGTDWIDKSEDLLLNKLLDEIDKRKLSVVYSSDYTFNADGATDDTANFTTLEASVKGERVDLLGKDYAVTTVPHKNRYVNGRFVVPFSYVSNGSTLTGTYCVNALETDTSSPITVLERDLRGSFAKIAYQPIQTSGLQGLCFDEPNRHIYSMYFDSSSGAEKSVIVRYSMDALDVYPDTVTPNLTTIATTVVGHQGLSLEYITNASPKLWSAVRYDATNYPLGHRQVARFNVADAADVSNLQLYTLFGSEFSYTGNATMVAISYDQRWLVATGRKSSRDFWIRVFDLNMLVNGGPEDYSDKWMYQFNIDPSILADDAGGAYTPIQNTACDGNFIYVLAGNATQNQKKIWQYTLSGKKVGENSTISVGLTQSQTDGTFYEPEAICFYKGKGQAYPSLAMLILTTGKKNYIYQCGGEPISIDGTWEPTATAVTNIESMSVSSAMYHLQNGFAILSGRVVGTSPSIGSIEFKLSLPFGSINTSLTQAQGTFSSSAGANGRVELVSADGTLSFKGVANSTASVAYSFMCMVRVIN